MTVAVAAIAFNPIFWNFVARAGIIVSLLSNLEWNSRFLTNAFGNKYFGCYFLGATIFTLGLIRDYLYRISLASLTKLRTSLVGISINGRLTTPILQTHWCCVILPGKSLRVVLDVRTWDHRDIFGYRISLRMLTKATTLAY
jgi:hypothetical protein